MLQAALLAGLNHLLEGSGWASARLARYAGRRARFELPPVHLELRVAPDGLFELPSEQAAPDVVIGLPPETPFLLPQGIDKVMSLAHVAGNAEFATELSFIFRRLDWDVEEDLSAVVGDIAAHRLVRGAQQLVGWQKQAATRLAENLAEYLAYENPLLVPGADFIALREGIGRFGAELTEVEARLAKLGP
ncbi:MAG: ubiquinone biosynthesis accessory factor UbiJ [Rhodocyclaceae bacterium]